MNLNIEVIPVFIQIIGDCYYFDVVAVNQNLESSKVGYIMINMKRCRANYSISKFLEELDEFDVEKLLDKTYDAAKNVGDFLS